MPKKCNTTHMPHDEFASTLRAIGLDGDADASAFLDLDRKTVFRMRKGDSAVDFSTAWLLRLMLRYGLTPKTINPPKREPHRPGEASRDASSLP